MVTDHHVVNHAQELTVVTHAGAELAVTGILAEDPVYDVVILETTGTDTPYMPLGGAESIHLGDATAVGLTLGTGRRTIPVHIGLIFPDDSGQRWIRFSGDITHGFSGGPLINKGGFVIGVTSSKEEGQADSNFALASDRIRELVDRAKNSVPLDNYNWKPPQYESLMLSRFQDPAYWYNKGVDALMSPKRSLEAFQRSVLVRPDFAPGYDALWKLALRQKDAKAQSDLHEEIEKHLPQPIADAIFTQTLKFTH